MDRKRAKKAGQNILLEGKRLNQMGHRQTLLPSYKLLSFRHVDCVMYNEST